MPRGVSAFRVVAGYRKNGMTRKEKRDAKNARHRRNERRREVLRILKRSPDLWKALADAADLIREVRAWT
jgi:hypothetical protein